jgi:hypothetical protein
MFDLETVAEMATQLHLAAWIGRSHPVRTGSTHLIGFLIAELLGSLGLADRVYAGGATAEPQLIGLDDLETGRRQDGPRLRDDPLCMTKMARVLDGDGPIVPIENGEETALDRPGNRHGDVQGLRAMTHPSIVGEVGRAPGCSGDHEVETAEDIGIPEHVTLGGLRFAIVGGQRTTTGLPLRHRHPVAGPLQQGDGGVVDRAKPLILDATGEKANGSGVTGAADVAHCWGGTAAQPPQATGDPVVSTGSQTCKPESLRQRHPDTRETHQTSGAQGGPQRPAIAPAPPGKLGVDLRARPLEGAAVGDHSRAHRLTSPAPETEVDDLGEGLVQLDGAIGHG